MSYQNERREGLPDSIGGYTIERKIARGGMGSVYLARGLGPGGVPRRFALKRMHPEVASDAYLRDMFLDEARLLARLDHPAVCRVVDFGEDTGSAFMAMEYLEGLPLNVFTDSKRSRGMRKEPRYFQMVARVMTNLLEGLHAAHELHTLEGKPLHVVHRDISPHNLFLLFDGTQRVLDFGIASASEQVRLTEWGCVKGKFPYMAPEQARGLVVDRRADIWSMGVVLWELLAGRRAFGPPLSRREIMEQSAKGLGSARQVDPSVPAALDGVVQRAACVRPEGRYATAREMARDLEFWLGSCGDSVPAADVGDWVRRTNRMMTEAFESTDTAIALTPGSTCIEFSQEDATSRRNQPSPLASTPGLNHDHGCSSTRATRPRPGSHGGDHIHHSIPADAPRRPTPPPVFVDKRATKERARRWAATSGMVASALLIGHFVSVQPWMDAFAQTGSTASTVATGSMAHSAPGSMPHQTTLVKPDFPASAPVVTPLVPEVSEAPSVAAQPVDEPTPASRALAEAPDLNDQPTRQKPPRQRARRAAREVASPRVVASPEVEAASAAQQTPALGRVRVQSVGAQGAFVYRDGSLVGRTPLDLTMPTGRHTLQVAASPDEPRTPLHVQVMAGMLVRVRVGLAP